MTSHLRSPAQHLERGQVVRFARTGRLCLRVDSGSLWITVDGQLDDIELDAGHSRVFEDASAVLASSLGGDAVFSELPAPESRRSAAGWRQRLHDRLRPPARGAAAGVLRVSAPLWP